MIYGNLWDAFKEILRGNITALNAYIKNKKKTQDPWSKDLSKEIRPRRRELNQRK